APSPSSVAGRQASPGAPARASVTANRDGAALGPTTAHPGERSPSGPWPPTVTPPSAAVSRPTTPLPPVPPPLPSPLTGSYISISGSNLVYGGQSGFWSSAANQQALINFWIDVAGHYETEPTVAGWDVFNEPAPPSVAAYDAWAQHVYDAITATDPHHVVVLEVSSANWNLPSVNGNRLLWSGH